MENKNQKSIQIMQGSVVSSKNGCTIVAISTFKKHQKYGKYFLRTKKFKASDEKTRNIGEKVEIITSKPMSKDKRFKVISK